MSRRDRGRWWRIAGHDEASRSPTAERVVVATATIHIFYGDGGGDNARPLIVSARCSLRPSACILGASETKQRAILAKFVQEIIRAKSREISPNFSPSCSLVLVLVLPKVCRLELGWTKKTKRHKGQVPTLACCGAACHRAERSSTDR